jgi:thermostable 8-oxoguanine DNA glycosylase
MMLTINPTDITKFDRTKDELELFWLFCVLVAGKNADWAAVKITHLLQNKPQDISPLAFLNQGDLHNVLVANKVGQYRRITKAIEESVALDLASATVEDLMGVFGVGPKTARFFILHTRKNAECAVLDTHILKWLKGVFNDLDVPNSTPSGKEYEKWERLAIKAIQANFGEISLAEADLLIWTQMSGRLQ